MRFRRFCSLLLSLPLILLIAFSDGSIKVSAYSGGRYMSSNEARQCFGDIIYATYFDGSDYVDCEFRYNKTFTQTPYNVDSASGSYTYQGDTWLEYKMYSSYGRPSMQPSEITFDLQPVYSIFDTTQIHTCICLSTQNDLSASVYQSPAWDWLYNGNSIHIENIDTTSNGDYRAMLMLDGYRYTYVCADLSSGSSVSGYSYRATFYGNSDSSSNPYNVYLELGLPYIDDSASGASGTFTTVSGGSGGDTNITVNVDMSETNEELQQQTGILSTISNWLSGFFTTLGNTVLSWFMPSQNFLSNWVARIKNILYDHLSPWGDMDDTISNVLDRIVTALGEGGVESVEFPALSVPGTDFSTQSISVPLWPSGSSSLQYWVELAVNLVSTIWVCNMVLNKIKSKILGESVVEVEELENNDN